MDDYIKREDALEAVLFELVGTGLQSAAIYAIREVPTADVVPKSEVEATVEKLMSATDKVICEAKAEVAREIFEDIERLIELYTVNTPIHMPFNYIDVLFAHFVAELKKKYTEDNNQ